MKSGTKDHVARKLHEFKGRVKEIAGNLRVFSTPGKTHIRRSAMQHTFLRTTLSAAVLSFLLVESVGCGYLLYPERIGTRSGRIDPAVAIMDGLGLLLFVVPGLVAFAVDFTNGTIYLGAGRKHARAIASDTRIIKADSTTIHDRAKLERLVSEHLGQPVRLDPGQVRISQVTEPDQVRERVAFEQNLILSNPMAAVAQ